ncbi:MAG: type II secretion system secretin GspD [Gammaproteobacteria bacterium]
MKLSPSLRAGLFAVLACTLPLVAVAAEPEPPIDRSDAGITLNLRDTDLQTLIAAVADLTGKNFVVDPRVKGKVTVYSSAPTNPAELYDVFLSILKVHGFAALDTGEVVKIVPDATARQSVDVDTPPSAGERITTAVIPLVNANAMELVAILRPLLPQEAHLAAVASGNLLVVADSAANVQRMVGIVRQIDRPHGGEVEVVELRHAQAEDVARAVSDAVLGPRAQQGAAPSGPMIVADPRTNSLLLGGTAAERAAMHELIAALDRPARGAEGRIDVVFLHYAEATELVDILQAVGDRVVQERGGAGGKAAAAGSAGDSKFLVHADENTNAVIIQAEPDLMGVIKSVIERLDVRRAQVLVEGVIAEVSSTKSDELGIQWKTSAPADGLFAGNLQAGIGSGPITSPFDDASAPALLSGLTLGYFSQGDLRALIRALGGDAYTNVLSTPTLVTLDNAEAEIVVGQNVPFITGQFTNDSTTPDNPFQTIERQDVGIVLRVKPQINEGNSVTLEIEQEVSNVARESSGADLITNKRSIKTNVLVDDRNIVVLGGLISDDKRESRQKIPLLGDIPVLGQLFRNDQGESVKTNLMVFLRPTIIRDAETNRALSRERYDYIRGRQESQEEEARFLLHEDGAVLPSFDGLME